MEVGCDEVDVVCKGKLERTDAGVSSVWSERRSNLLFVGRAVGRDIPRVDRVLEDEGMSTGPISPRGELRFGICEELREPELGKTGGSVEVEGGGVGGFLKIAVGGD